MQCPRCNGKTVLLISGDVQCVSPVLCGHTWTPTEKPRARTTDPDTSHKAAKDNAPRAGSQRYRILQFVKDAGPCIPDDITAGTGIELGSACPRIAELKTQGFLVLTGEQRKGKSGSDRDVVATPEQLANRKGGDE